MSNRNDQNLLFIVIGAVVGAIATSITAKLLSRDINYWLAGTIIITVLLITALTYWIYEKYYRFPYIKWFINTDYEDNKKGRKSTKRLCLDNPDLNPHEIDKAWEFTTNEYAYAVIGPYITLKKGDYQAKFILKVNDTAGTKRIIDIDVVSRCDEKGDKKLAARTLTTTDFNLGRNTYHEFALDFYVSNEESDLEFRIQSLNNKHRVTVNYIQLRRGA